MPIKTTPIGIFDSGYGGLTIFRSIRAALPQYDYVYLGDNAHAPYGNLSLETIYHYTLKCVKRLFSKGCPLVILACNTASANALRRIQQDYLPEHAPDKRVLGVIRPTAEVIGNYSKTGVVGVMGTKGTIHSGAYLDEIHRFFPDMTVFQQVCRLWVPLIEDGEYDSPGADYFVQKYTQNLLAQSAEMDTILLGCTHYPLLADKIRKYLPGHMRLVSQGTLVADSLTDYLQRHPWLEEKISRKGRMKFFTTDDPEDFDNHAAVFFGQPVQSAHLNL